MNRWLWVWILAGFFVAAEQSSCPADEKPWDNRVFSADIATIISAVRALPLPTDADVEFLLCEQSYYFDKQGCRRYVMREVFRCLTKEGVDNWSYVEDNWAPWCEDKPTLRARVITPDGKAHWLDPKSIGEAPISQDEKILSDRRIVRAPLPALAVGAVVELETEVRETKPFFTRGRVGRFPLAVFYPTQKIRLTIDVPRELPLRYEVRGGRLEPKRSEKDGRLRLVFEKNKAKVLKYLEADLPPESPPYEEVVFATGKSWADVASGYADIVEKQMDLSAVKSLSRETVGKEKDPGKKAAVLLETVHRLVRYTGVEFGEAAIEPRTPIETLTRRYGDCKDQATLLVAMLRAVDIPANVALLKIVEPADVVPDMPGLSAFNHAIVYVPGPPEYWIDPTAEYVPFGRLPVCDQDRLALITDMQHQNLVRTPRSDYKENLIEEIREYTLQKEDRGNVREIIRATGSFAQQHRRSYAARSEQDLKKGWKEYAQSNYKTRTIASMKSSALRELEKPFEIEVEISDAQISLSKETPVIAFSPYKIFRRLPPYFLAIKPPDDKIKGEKDPDVPDKRQAPLVLPEPHVSQLEYLIAPPPDYIPEKLPEDKVKQIGPATISQKYAWKDGKLQAIFRFDTGEGRFTAEEAEDLRHGIADLGIEGDPSRWEERIAFSHGALQKIAAGKLDEAITQCMEDLKIHPDSAETYMRFSKVLLSAGFGEAARRSARKAAELAPDSVAAQSNLAEILACDLIGRRFRRGMDWFGASKAFQSALELDPSNVTSRWHYALFLERDQCGRRYGQAANLTGAIQEYRKMLKEGVYENSKENLTFTLAMALMHSEKFSEAQQLLAESDKMPLMNPINLAITMIEQGPAAVRDKAEQMESSSQKRSALLRTASDILLEIRYYQHAKSVMDLLPDNVKQESQSHVQFLSMARRIEKSAVAEDSPFWPVEQLYMSLLADERSDKPLSDLFNLGANEADVAQAIDEANQPLIPYTRLIYANELAPRRMADMVSLFHMSSKAGVAADSGYQITVTGLWPQASIWYVLYQKERFRLLPPGRHRAILGAAAMECLKTNDYKKAEQWLDWAYQDHKKEVGWVDPFSGSPFGRIWWGRNHADQQILRLAAAALACEGRLAQLAIPVLEAQKNDVADKGLALQIDRALGIGYLNNGNWPELLEMSDKVLSEHKESHEAMNWKSVALWVLGRTDELRIWLHLQLGREDISSQAREALALQASKIGDFELALKNLRALNAQGNATSLGLNELAWIAVIYDTLDDATLQLALKARKQATDNESAYLNTLAAVYAGMGKTNEALDTLYKCVDARGGDPQNADWCVLGRMAEHLGLHDVAVSLYNKVTRPRRQIANDSYALAQRRLEILALSPSDSLSMPPENVKDE
jgi:tetratricopeptide (TPR) repeat protein/transglutaminase-like putative cysteine protease